MRALWGLLLVGCATVVADDDGDTDPCAPVALAGEGDVPDALDRALTEALAEEHIRRGAAASVVAVRTPAGGVYVHAFGHDTWEDDAPRAVPTAGFGIGSITKSFVAVVILQLVDEGVLDLNDTLDTWYGGVVPRADEMTIQLALRHGTGIVDYTDTAEFIAMLVSQSSDGFPIDEVIARSADDGLRFDPGTAYAYSNTNYFILGRIAERETGETLEDLIRTRVLEPNGLDRTWMMGFDDPDACAPLATGHAFGQLGFDIDPRWQWGSGGLAADIRDLLHWGLAVFEGDAVTEAQRTAMTTPGNLPSHTTQQPVPYGYGLQARSTPCGTVWGHTGSTMGYQSDLFVTDDGTMVAAMHNDFGYEVSELAYRACEVVQAQR